MTVARAPFRWLVYALGGGMGHLSRALALARAAARRGHSIRILCNSPFAAEVLSPGTDRMVDLSSRIAIEPLNELAGREETARSVQQELRSGGYDVLVTDTFPRGLVGELADVLPEIEVAKILVQRDLNPRYVARFDLHSFAGHYDGIVAAGEPGPLSDVSRSVATEPWLVCDAQELFSRAEARKRLGLASSDVRPLVVVCGCGKPDELVPAAELSVRLQEHLGNRAAVRFAGLSRNVSDPVAGLHVRCWPLLALLRGVDLLIGAGGYHTVYESRATGTPLLGIARHRLYDRQFRRLRAEERIEDVSDMMVRAAQFVRELPRRRTMSASTYRNGAHAAVRMIESVTDAAAKPKR